jgi:branched-chain amino acid transport system substrate-binding protein
MPYRLTYKRLVAYCQYNNNGLSEASQREVLMNKLLAGMASLAIAACAATAAQAQGTVKIGVIMPYSGQFADLATQMDNGIKLYIKQKGDTVAGKKIEIVRKDTGGVAPDVAVRLAQELVTRENVDILAGFSLSPNAIAVSKIATEAKKFMVIMNAATRSSPCPPIRCAPR